jgi:hypothetical protein
VSVAVTLLKTPVCLGSIHILRSAELLDIPAFSGNGELDKTDWTVVKPIY